MGQINTNNYPTVDSLADADLLIVENAIHGTGTTTPKQLKEKAIGTDPLETTAQTVTGAINELKDAIDSGTGGAGRTLAGMGKEVSYSNQIITTDIEISRGPKVGDRFLIYFPDSCSNPRSLVINVNGTPTTLSWEIIGGDTYKGLCAIEVKAGMISDMALEKVWQEDELSAGTGISIVNNAIINTAPQLGENVGDRTYTTAITDGDLGSVTLSNDYVILNFKASAQPNSSTGKYFIQEAASSYHLYAALVDMAGNDFTDDIPAGTTLICKNKDGGDGTSADPYHVTVLGIGAGGGADELNDLSDVNISSPTNGQVLTYNGTSGKWGNNTNFEVDASGNVTAGGNITDGQGNVLSEVSALEITQSGNPIEVKAVGIKAKELSVELEPIQDLHGYDKPWVGGAGKNKCTPDNFDFTSAGAWYSLSGVNADTPTDGSKITLAAGSYIFGLTDAVNLGQLQILDANSTLIAHMNQRTFTLAETKDLYVRIKATGTGAISGKIQIEAGSATSAWTPYTNICPISGRTQTSVTTRNEDNTESETATVTLGQTVYGGIVDFKTGKVTITHAIATYTGAENNWTYSSGWSKTNTSAFYLADSIPVYFPDGDYLSVTKCNELPPMTRNELANGDSIGVCMSGTNYPTIRVPKDIDTVAKLQTWLSTNNLQFVYELATPTEITVLPQALYMLSGYNYITADGNMEITLIPESIFDVAKAYTDSALADKTDTSVVGPVESGTTASRAYAVGEHFIRNDKFCTCISAIASGATLTQGTNYVEGTIAERVNDVEDAVESNLIWSNTDTSQTFSEQTIQMTVPNYAYYIAEFRNRTTSTAHTTTFALEKGKTYMGSSYYGAKATSRGFIINDNGIYFGNAQNTEIDNTLAIPVKIIGVGKM